MDVDHRSGGRPLRPYRELAEPGHCCRGPLVELFDVRRRRLEGVRYQRVGSKQIDRGVPPDRVLLQESLGRIAPALGKESSLVGAVVSTGVVVTCWGWMIATGSVETIWPMFGIANQLLAVIALSVVTTWIVNQGRARYAWVTLGPLAFVTTTTMTAGWQLVDRFRKGNDNLNLVLVAIMLACVLVVLADSARACVSALRKNGDEAGKK